ncbi:cell division protein MraZ [Candidatus Mycoplasma haematobovis]|uniref:Transcriptional regulator MraZ n=1 Tax=Candidatus Mycoplasma haematobovis TaxID=432608 RepID=A0A1A9QEJ0_9MOLU|nr:cell division protein MraZ [Candidatus Mycoplasma haematobovis]OAL10109.1 cell division protein MraZ [Candidatus Mycoplasma haematobovis]
MLRNEKGIVFIGEHEVTMDSKNRITIPSKWKEKLGLEIVISKHYDDCLAIRTPVTFENYCEKLMSYDENDIKARALRRETLGRSHEIALDKWYRFVIPGSLATNLQKGTLVMVGVGDLIEVWSKEALKNWRDDERNRLETVGQELSQQK